MNELIEQVAEKVDSQLDFKKLVGGIGGQAIEWFDKKLVEGALNYAVLKAPEDYKTDIEVLLTAYLTEQYEPLTAAVVLRVNKLVDVPGLDETEEEMLFKSLSSAFLKIIQRKLAA